jgi:hypothetical protein
MAHVFLNSSDQGVLIFKIWQSLAYKTRLFISAVMVLAGLSWQAAAADFLPGAVLLVLGVILVLPSGVDNRAKIGKYDPAANWEKVEEKRLTGFLDHLKKVGKWDRSTMDVTSWQGVIVFLFIFGILGFLFYQAGMEWQYRYLWIIAVDGAILLFPFWFTGLRLFRRGVSLQTVTEKIKAVLELVNKEPLKKMRGPHGVDYYVLLKGEGEPLPIDVKFRVNIRNAHEDFLGLYGQIVTNTVQGAPHLYFYMVLVAKKGFNLKDAYKRFDGGKTLVKQYKPQKDVEVFVIRQDTKKVAAGYRTTGKQMAHIYEMGLRVAEKAAVK